MTLFGFNTIFLHEHDFIWSQYMHLKGTATTDATSETSTNLSVSSNGPRQGKNLQSKDEKQGKNLQSKDKNNEVILTLMVGSLHEHPQAHINLTSEESQN